MLSILIPGHKEKFSDNIHSYSISKCTYDLTLSLLHKRLILQLTIQFWV